MQAALLLSSLPLCTPSFCSFYTACLRSRPCLPAPGSSFPSPYCLPPCPYRPPPHLPTVPPVLPTHAPPVLLQAGPAPTKKPTWLDAWHDPVAGVSAYSPCVHTCDLFGDGDYRLVVADTDQKLKVGCALWLECGTLPGRGGAEWAGTRGSRHGSETQGGCCAFWLECGTLPGEGLSNGRG